MGGEQIQTSPEELSVNFGRERVTAGRKVVLRSVFCGAFVVWVLRGALRGLSQC